MPSTLKEIGDTAFIHCTSLKTLTIPSGLTIGGKQIFDSCTFETVIFEEGVETIFFGMFYNCEYLSYVDMSNLDTSNVKDMMGMSAYNYATLFKKQRLVDILKPYHKE